MEISMSRLCVLLDPTGKRTFNGASRVDVVK